MIDLPTVLLLAATTQGQAVHFVYERAPGAERCPDEQTLREAIAARLGRDPFSDSGPIELQLELGREGKELRATLTFHGGGAEGRREIRSQHSDCSELSDAVVLAIGIAVDSVSPTEPVGPPEPAAPSPAPLVIAPAPQALPPDNTPRSIWIPHTAFAYLGGLATFGVEPSPSAGGLFGFELRWAAASLGVEARGDLTASTSNAQGSAASSLIAGTLVPCFRLSWFGLCALATFGATEVQDDQQLTLSHPYAAVGARLLAELMLGTRFALRAHADLAFPLVTNTLSISGEPVWETPPIGGDLGADLLVRIW